MKPTLHLDVLLQKTDEGYEAHCLQFDLVEVVPTAEEAEQAIKDVITAHIEYPLAHDNREYLFRSAPLEAWDALRTVKSNDPSSLAQVWSTDEEPRVS